PALAMTSAEKLDGTPSQLLMTGLPACHNSRTPFGRAIGSLLAFASRCGDPASYAGQSQPVAIPSAGLDPAGELGRQRRGELLRRFHETARKWMQFVGPVAVDKQPLRIDQMEVAADL